LEFYSAHRLKQQFTDSNVAPLGHIILIQSQLVFVPTLADKQRLQILQPLDWFDRGSNPRSTVLGASTLTIKLTTVSWGSKWRHRGYWRHTEGIDDILGALTAYWGHWRHTEGTDDILRALTTYWGHWRHIEGTDDILRALTAYWGH
jgi:hypothetical protein